jgi:hypothetical protein
MLRGSRTHAPAHMTVALAVALALGTVTAPRVAAAAEAPTSSASPSAVSPPAATPPAASSPAEVVPSGPPPAAPSPSAAPPTELDGPAPLPQPGAGGSIQSGLPGCAAWTDRCVICQRDGGVVACSNIGIACQPQPLMCLRPEATPENGKKPPN